MWEPHAPQACPWACSEVPGGWFRTQIQPHGSRTGHPLSRGPSFRECLADVNPQGKRRTEIVPAAGNSCPTPRPLQLNPALGGSRPKAGIRDSAPARPCEESRVTAIKSPPPPPSAHLHPGGGRACARREGDGRPGTTSAMLKWGPRPEGVSRPVRRPARRPALSESPFARRASPRPPPSGKGLRVRAAQGLGALGPPGQHDQAAHSPATHPSRAGTAAAAGAVAPSTVNMRPTPDLHERRARLPTAPPLSEGPAHSQQTSALRPHLQSADPAHSRQV